MKPRLAILRLASLAIVLFASSALAGVIELSASATPALTKHGLALSVRLANHGNEPARAIQLEALLPQIGVSKKFPGPGILKPGEARSITINLKRRQHAKGLHPVVLKIRYQDDNQYPFSTLAYGLYRVGKPARPVLLARGIPSSVAESGRAAFALANRAPDPLEIDILYFAPDELELSDDSLKTRIAEDDKEILEVGLTNRTALTGATYPVLALVRYEWQGSIFTAPALVPVSIDPEREAPPGWWVFAALLALFAALALWLGIRSRLG